MMMASKWHAHRWNEKASTLYGGIAKVVSDFVTVFIFLLFASYVNANIVIPEFSTGEGVPSYQKHSFVYDDDLHRSLGIPRITIEEYNKFGDIDESKSRITMNAANYIKMYIANNDPELLEELNAANIGLSVPHTHVTLGVCEALVEQPYNGGSLAKAEPAAVYPAAKAKKWAITRDGKIVGCEFSTEGFVLEFHDQHQSRGCLNKLVKTIKELKLEKEVWIALLKNTNKDGAYLLESNHLMPNGRVVSVSYTIPALDEYDDGMMIDTGFSFGGPIQARCRTTWRCIKDSGDGLHDKEREHR